MLALAMLALLPLQEPQQEPPQDAPRAPALVVPDAAECLALVEQGKRDDARACYAKRATLDGEEGARARAIADLVGALRLADPGDLEAPEAHVVAEGGPPSIGELFSTGKGELVVTSTLAGAYLAELGAVSLLDANPNAGYGPLASTLLLSAPVFGGGGGLLVGTLAVLFIPSITPGDANAMRAFLILGGADSLVLSAWFNVHQNQTGLYASNALVPLSMGGVVVATAAVGAGVAAFLDVPEEGGSMALSGALWAPVLSVLVANMFGGLKADFDPNTGFDRTADRMTNLVALATNVGFAGGMALSPLVPVSRAETWAIDVGGGVGMLAGWSFATATRAGNPFLGWGEIAAGTVLGMGAGFAAARLIPPWIEVELKAKNVNVAPVASPDPKDPTSVVVGAALTGSL